MSLAASRVARAVASRAVAMARRGRVAANLVVISRVGNPVAVAAPAEPGPAKAAVLAAGPGLAKVQALGLAPATTAATTALSGMLPATAISRRRATRKATNPQQQPAQQPETQRAQPCPSH